MEISKQDYKLFREKITVWQERYMEQLNSEYMKILSADGTSSDRFWTLLNRINSDKKSKGVIIQIQKQSVILDIAELINDGVITFADLEGFSSDLIETVRFFMS